ncbi:MAG: hypothetical protein FDZ70_08930 [Actinobacteria bacterium]|nr:MAG: hypothetical protein FDZ70_08930 [Actinomycetota bacterium]
MRTKVTVTITAAAFLLASGLAAGGCSPKAATPSGGTSEGAGAAGTVPTGMDVASVIKDRCTKCHGLDRIKSASKDLAEWQATIAQMRSNGAELTDAEGAAMALFLADGGAAGL